MDSAHALAVGRFDPPLCDYGKIKEHIDTEKVRWTCPDGVLTMTTYPRVPGSNALELSSEPYVKTCIERLLADITHQIDEMDRAPFVLHDLYRGGWAKENYQVVLCFLKACGLLEPARPRKNRAVDSSVHLSAMSLYHSLHEEWINDGN